MASAGFFSHIDPGRGALDRRLGAARISWRAAAENIFEQQGHSGPVRTAVTGWMRSAGHRRNILDARFRESAVGIAVRRGTWYYTQVFLLR